MPAIQITVGDLVAGFEALQELSKLKIKLNPSFWLGRQQRKLLADYASFTEKRLEQFKELGVETPAGSGQWTVQPERAGELQARVNELLKADMSVDVEPRPVAFLALDDVEPRLLAATWFLWTDETAPAA